MLCMGVFLLTDKTKTGNPHPFFLSNLNIALVHKAREREEREERESRSHLDFGVRPARERASSSVTALSELWLITTRGVSVPGVKTRLFGVVGVVRTFVGRVLFPGDGGFHRSVAAGFSYRRVEVSFASPSSAQVPER
ncbi:hypothetical protein DY000_02054594 [Brassica cretica]|uniref:Uncharacterized protein n=1 Tax=Brassica cretica TaxID=69181 RepID=A0ABQ7ACY1_BRACR|nr:hypothetical protein DY000_02054594 [Brassica cretica]